MPGSTEGLGSVFEEEPNNPQSVNSQAWKDAVAASEAQAAAATGKDAPKQTGGGMTSQADSISTTQLAKLEGDYTPPPTPESAYEQLANAQADQYLKMTKELDPLTTGAALPSIDAKMASGAESMLGQSSTSPISQWLNQQTQAAQSQYAPTASAGLQVAGAENRAQSMEAGALQNLGQAETALMQAAPYEQLLQSLAQEVPYHLSQNYPFPGLTGQNVPASIQAAEKYVGVNTTGQGTGVSGVPTLGTPQTAAQGVVSPSPSTNPTPTTYP